MTDRRVPAGDRAGGHHRLAQRRRRRARRGRTPPAARCRSPSPRSTYAARGAQPRPGRPRRRPSRRPRASVPRPRRRAARPAPPAAAPAAGRAATGAAARGEPTAEPRPRRQRAAGRRVVGRSSSCRVAGQRHAALVVEQVPSPISPQPSSAASTEPADVPTMTSASRGSQPVDLGQRVERADRPGRAEDAAAAEHQPARRHSRPSPAARRATPRGTAPARRRRASRRGRRSGRRRPRRRTTSARSLTAWPLAERHDRVARPASARPRRTAGAAGRARW